MAIVWTHLEQWSTWWKKQLMNSEGNETPVASSGISFLLWRMHQHFWLICLLFPILWLVQTPLSTWRLWLAVSALLFFAASYTWLMWPHPASPGARKRSRSPMVRILFVALAALVLMLSLFYGSAFLWLFIGVSAIAGVILSMRSAFPVIVIFTLFPLIISVGMSGGIMRVDWLQIIPLMLLVRGLGVDMMGVARLSGAIRELHAAREERARLKVEEERMRMARDLHDLLGHTLSLITLKSELAGCLVQEEPEHCAQEISEIEQVARQALREVREAVAGYRQPRLDSELNGARQLLEAAGITCQIEQRAGELPPPLDAVLAWTVREGVTNVIRHSRARFCLIRLSCENGTACAEVVNDGDRREVPPERRARQGSGLAGLRERVSVYDGRMEAGPLSLSGQERFCLRVELPIQHEAERPQEVLS